MIRQRKSKSRRRGTAVVEFAVCLPILVILVLGAIECTSMIFLKQSLNVVAYEAIRVAIRNDGTTAAANARANEVITERDIDGVNFSFSPSNIDGLDRGTPIQVTVTAPCGANSVFTLNFFSGNLEAQAFMVKE
jgi:Flp pilus assembly protein TadG